MQITDTCEREDLYGRHRQQIRVSLRRAIETQDRSFLPVQAARGKNQKVFFMFHLCGNENCYPLAELYLASATGMIHIISLNLSAG